MPLLKHKIYPNSNHRRKLLQKPHIVFKQQPNIMDIVQPHRLAFDAHPKGKARVFIGINVAVAQYVRVHHTTAKDFEPTGTFGKPVVFFVVHADPDIHFGTRLGEREVAGAQADFWRAEHFLGEIHQRLFHISETYPLIHIQPFHLVELGM